MLTDRQEKFYIRIRELVSKSSQASASEQSYLEYVVEDIHQDNTKFKPAITFLIWHLKEIEEFQAEGLTPEVKKLFEDLKAAYGEPDSEPREILKGKDWTQADPDYVFIQMTGSSFVGWIRRNPKAFEDGSKVRGYVNLVLFLSVVIGFWWTPVPAFLEEKFGDTGNYISLVLMCFIIILWVGYFGSFKRDKKKKRGKNK